MEDLLTKLNELDSLTQERVLHSIEIMGDGGWKLRAIPLAKDQTQHRKVILGQGIQAARELMITWKHEYRAKSNETYGASHGMAY